MIENINEYITKLKENKPAIKAQKTGYVLARIGVVGEQIETYVENGTLETVNCVKVDENGNPGIVITMANSDRKAVIDKNGHTNTYIIPRITFNKKYQNSEKVCETEQIFELITL